MRDKYDFTAIESKWQHIWEEENAFATIEDENKEKYYVLEMFPYPSGKSCFFSILAVYLRKLTCHLLNSERMRVS